MPTFTGTLEGIPDDLGLYDQYADADLFPITFTANNGGTLAALRSVSLSLPACKFTGSTPNAQLDGLTTQSVPFTAFHNGVNPVATLTVQTSDSAF